MLNYEEFKTCYNSESYGRMGALYFARQLGTTMAQVIEWVKQIENEVKNASK